MREETNCDDRGQTTGISKYYDEGNSGRAILHLIITRTNLENRSWDFNAHRAIGPRNRKNRSGNRFCRTAEKRVQKSRVADGTDYNSSASRVCEFPDDVILFLDAKTSVGKKTVGRLSSTHRGRKINYNKRFRGAAESYNFFSLVSSPGSSDFSKTINFQTRFYRLPPPHLVSRFVVTFGAHSKPFTTSDTHGYYVYTKRMTE